MDDDFACWQQSAYARERAMDTQHLFSMPIQQSFSDILNASYSGQSSSSPRDLLSLVQPKQTDPWSPQNLQHQHQPQQDQPSAETSRPGLSPCGFCSRPPRNHSDAGRHLNIHIRPYICVEESCPATRGFATVHDLERHKKSVHNMIPQAGPKLWYICPVGGTEGCRKMWPRRDNLRKHVARYHPGHEEEAPLIVDPDAA